MSASNADDADYCAALLREGDRDAYLAGLFAPAERRASLFALQAFVLELTQIPARVTEPLMGEMRLQWWREVLGGEREAAGHPLATALLAANARHGLDLGALMRLIDVEAATLHGDPCPTLAALEARMRETHGGPLLLGAGVLGATGPALAQAAAPAGIALGLTGLLRRFAREAARGRVRLPQDRIAAHGLEVAQVSAAAVAAQRGETPPLPAGLDAALADLRRRAEHHRAAARAPLRALAAQALPAFLPLALVGGDLRVLGRSPPLRPPILAGPLRRQWRLWRAARRPARIAG